MLHVKKQTCTLIITWYDSRNCAKLVLKPLVAKNGLLFQFCVLLLSCRLYSSSLHDDYSLLLYFTWSIHIVALPFLINWNKKRCIESNILTMDLEIVLENSSSVAVNALPNTIIYLKTKKYLNIRLRQIY